MTGDGWIRARCDSSACAEVHIGLTDVTVRNSQRPEQVVVDKEKSGGRLIWVSDLRSTPLDEIRPADARDIIRDVLKRGQVPVEVARFGSAI